MAHKHELAFVRTVINHLTNDWSNKKVLEIGSYDVNGSIRSLLSNSLYIGVDLVEGPGVDRICEGDRLDYDDDSFDMCISCECFEHNPNWLKTFENMYRMSRGAVVFTCATIGRMEHGTIRTEPKASPGTQNLGWDYYKNLSKKDFIRELNFSDMFSAYTLKYSKHSHDLYFVGIKNRDGVFNFDKQRFESELVKASDMTEARETKYPILFKVLRELMTFPLHVFSYLPDNLCRELSFVYLKLFQRIGSPIKIVLQRGLINLVIK